MSGFTANVPDSRLLQGVVIVDLSRVLAGPFSTMILSQLGARIIKVEIPGTGDDSRAFGPFANGKSLYFSSINFNKESIALNLKHPDDRAIFERLLEKADVLVENYRPGTMEKLGYGWAILHDRFPRLIYSAASGFGDTGPYSKLAAYDVVVQGLGGLMSLTGYPGGRPVRVGVSVGDEVAGLYLTIGTIAALLSPYGHGPRRKDRRRNARLPSAVPRGRHHSICKDGPSASPSWHAPSLDRPVSGVQGKGCIHHHCCRE